MRILGRTVLGVHSRSHRSVFYSLGDQMTKRNEKERKRRNPQDLTLRNLSAIVKRLDRHGARITKLERKKKKKGAKR